MKRLKSTNRQKCSSIFKKDRNLLVPVATKTEVRLLGTIFSSGALVSIYGSNRTKHFNSIKKEQTRAGSCEQPQNPH